MALSSKAMSLGDLGQFEESHKCSKDAYSLVQGQGHEIESSILNNHGTVSLWQGRWQDAMDLSKRSIVIAEQVSAPYLFACAVCIGAYGRWMLEKDEKAIDSLRQMIGWVEEKGMFLYSSFFYGWISDALAGAGKYDEACQYARLGLKRADLQDRVGETMCFRTLATISAFSDIPELQSPEFYLREAMKSAAERHSPHERAVTQLHLAKCLGSDNDETAGLLSEAISAFKEMGMPWHLSEAEKLSVR